MNTCRLLFTLATLLGTTAVAQDEVETLASATRRATWIAVVEVRGGLANDGAEHRADFAVLRSLHGSGPAAFSLREPCGHTCGRALHGLTAGSRLLAFLRRERDTTRLLGSSARNLVPLSEGLEQHVEALLRATTPSARLALLTGALTSAERRIRQDAAAVLPQLRELEQASAADRRRIVAALDPACRGADPACVGLTRAAERLHLSEALETLVACTLTDVQPGLTPLFLDAVPRIDADRAAELIDATLPPDPAGRARAVALLARLPVPRAEAVLLRLARGADTDFATATGAGAALLARGMAPAVLETNTSPQLLHAASRRAAAPGRRFRSIFLGSQR